MLSFDSSIQKLADIKIQPSTIEKTKKVDPFKHMQKKC